MRIIRGSAKGARLHASARNRMRPTSDKVRTALFGILEARVLIEGANILDLYAGTGSLGIEALSRGGVWADFVEKDPRHCASLRNNLSLIGMTKQSKIYCNGVERILPTLRDQYDLIFADPPYILQIFDKLLDAIAESNVLSTAGILVIEHSKYWNARQQYANLSKVDSRQYGDTLIDFFRHENTEW